MNSTMQFRDYFFRHNPHSITVGEQSAVARHFCPGKGVRLQNMGKRGRRVECRGTFFGDSFSDAMGQLTEFRRRVDGDNAGFLFLPGLEPFIAQLEELGFDARGDGRIIPYTMIFVESQAGL